MGVGPMIGTYFPRGVCGGFHLSGLCAQRNSNLSHHGTLSATVGPTWLGIESSGAGDSAWVDSGAEPQEDLFAEVGPVEFG